MADEEEEDEYELLDKVDTSLLSRQQKLHMYRNGICPRPLWDLTINNFPYSWIEKNLEALATRYHKRWAGLAKCADANWLYLPKENGGLQLPSTAVIFKKMKCTLSASIMTSKDSLVRHLATRRTLEEEQAVRPVFKPHQEVVAVMKEDPGATRKLTTSRVKSKIFNDDVRKRIKHSAGLQRQENILSYSDRSRSPEMWSSVILTLSENIFKFSLNAITDTLPHNSNLHLWGKVPSPACKLCSEKQTLYHVLNNCSEALNLRRYNHRHDSILQIIFQFLKEHLEEGTNIIADLSGHPYLFPQHITNTDCRPDVVLWNKSTIHLLELTVPFETGFANAKLRKEEKYYHLIESCRGIGYEAHLLTIEVGSRGFLNTESFDHLYRLTTIIPKKRTIKELEKAIIKTCLQCTYDILVKRNWTDHHTESITGTI